MRIAAGGALSRRWSQYSRTGLLAKLYPRQAALLVGYVGTVALGDPLRLVTFVTLPPPLLLTEARTLSSWRDAN